MKFLFQLFSYRNYLFIKVFHSSKALCMNMHINCHSCLKIWKLIMWKMIFNNFHDRTNTIFEFTKDTVRRIMGCLLSHFVRHRNVLTHWGRVTHIFVNKLTIIDSHNGLSPGRRQAIFWINAGILSIGPLGTNFSEILIEIYTFSFRKMHLKMSSGKWRPSCLGLSVLNEPQHPGSVSTCWVGQGCLVW